VIPADTSAGAAEILEKTMEVERRFEREFEKRLSQAGRVETVHGDAANRLQEKCGGLGASAIR
jgi:hypothetical protein